jgi:hypothetical protein
MHKGSKRSKAPTPPFAQKALTPPFARFTEKQETNEVKRQRGVFYS